MNIVHRCRFTEWQPSAVTCLTIAPSGRRFAILRANGNLEMWSQVIQTNPDSVLAVTDQGIKYELSKFLSNFQPLPTKELIDKPLQNDLDTSLPNSTATTINTTEKIHLASQNEHLFRHASMFYLSTQWTCTLTIPGTGQNVFSSLFWSHIDPVANPHIDLENTTITDRLFTLGTNGRIVEWDLLTQLPKFSTQSHGGSILCGTMSPSGTQIAVGCQDGTIRLFDISKIDQEPVHKKTFSKHKTPIGCIDWLHFSHIKPNHPQPQQQSHRPGTVTSAAYQRIESSSWWDPPLIASGGYDGVLRVWNTTTGACTLEYKAAKLRFNVSRNASGSRNTVKKLRASGNAKFKSQSGLRNVQIRGLTIRGDEGSKQYKKTLKSAKSLLSAKVSKKRVNINELEKDITKLNSSLEKRQKDDSFARLQQKQKEKRAKMGMGDESDTILDGDSEVLDDMFSSDFDSDEDQDENMDHDDMDMLGDDEEDEDDFHSDDESNSEESEAEPTEDDLTSLTSAKNKSANKASRNKKGNKNTLVNISKFKKNGRSRFHMATGRVASYNSIRKVKWLDVETIICLDETSHLLVVNARTGVVTSSLSLQQPLTVPTDLAIIPATLHTRSVAHQHNVTYNTKFNYQVHPDNVIPGQEVQLLSSLFSPVVENTTTDTGKTPPQYISVLKSKQVYVPFPLVYISGVNGRVIELSCTRQLDLSATSEQNTVFNPFAHTCKFVSTGLHTAHTHDILSLCLAPVTTYNSTQLTLLSSGVDSVVSAYAVHPFNINDAYMVKTYFQYLRPLKLAMLAKPPSITTSNYTSPWSHHWTIGRHQRDFSQEQIKELLENAKAAMDPIEFLQKQALIERPFQDSRYHIKTVAGEELQQLQVCLCPDCNISNIPSILNSNIVARLIHSLHLLRSENPTASTDSTHYCRAKPKAGPDGHLQDPPPTAAAKQSPHIPQYHFNQLELDAKKPQSNLISYLPLNNLELPMTLHATQQPPEIGSQQAFLNIARIHSPRLIKLLRTSPTLQFIQQQPPKCPIFAYPRGFGVDIYTITNHDQLSVRDKLLQDPKTQKSHTRLQLNNVLCDLQLYTGTVIFDRQAVVSTLLSMYTMRQFQQDHYLKEKIMDSLTRRHSYNADGSTFDQNESIFDENGKLVLPSPISGVLGTNDTSTYNSNSTAVSGATNDGHIHALDLEYAHHQAAPYLFRDNWKLGRWNFIDPALGLHHHPAITYQSTTPTLDGGDSDDSEVENLSQNTIESIYPNERVMNAPGSNKEIKLPKASELPNYLLSLRLQLSAVSAISTTLLSPNGRLLLISDATSIKLFGLAATPKTTKIIQVPQGKKHTLVKKISQMDDIDSSAVEDDDESQEYSTRDHAMVPIKIQFPPAIPTLNQYIRSILGPQNDTISIDDIPDSLYEQCVEEHYYISLFTQLISENGCQTATFSPCSSMLAVSLTPYAGAVSGTNNNQYNAFEKTPYNDASSYPHLGTVILIDLMTYQMIGYIQRNKIVFFTKSIGVSLPQPAGLPSMAPITTRSADPEFAQKFATIPTLSNLMKSLYKQQYLRQHFITSQVIAYPTWSTIKKAIAKATGISTPAASASLTQKTSVPLPAATTIPAAPSAKANLFKRGNAALKAQTAATAATKMVDSSSSSSSSDSDSDEDSGCDSDNEDKYFSTPGLRHYNSLRTVMYRHPNLFTQRYLEKNSLDIHGRYQAPLRDPELQFTDSPDFNTQCAPAKKQSHPLYFGLDEISSLTPTEQPTSSDLVTVLQFSPCGRYISTLDKNNTIRLYQLLDKCFTPTMVHLQTLPQNNDNLSLSIRQDDSTYNKGPTSVNPSVLSYKLLPTVTDLKQSHLSIRRQGNRTMHSSDENQLINNINVRTLLFKSIGPNRLERVLRHLVKRVLILGGKGNQFKKTYSKSDFFSKNTFVDIASTLEQNKTPVSAVFKSGNKRTASQKISVSTKMSDDENASDSVEEIVEKGKKGKMTPKEAKEHQKLVEIGCRMKITKSGSFALDSQNKLFFESDSLGFPADPITHLPLSNSTDEFINSYDPILAGESVAKYATQLRRCVRVDEEGFNPHHLFTELIHLFLISTYNTPISRLFLNKHATQEMQTVGRKMNLFAPYKKLLADSSVSRLSQLNARFRSNYIFGNVDFNDDVFPSITGSYDNGHYFVYDTNTRAYLGHNSTRAFETGYKVWKEETNKDKPEDQKGYMKTVKDISTKLQHAKQSVIDPLARAKLAQEAINGCADDDFSNQSHPSKDEEKSTSTALFDPLLLPKKQSYTSQIMPFKEMGTFNEANAAHHPILHHADVSPVFSTSSHVTYRPVVSADTNPYEAKPSLFGGLLPSFNITFSTCEDIYSLTLPLHRVYPSVFRSIIETSYYQIIEVITLLDEFNQSLLTAPEDSRFKPDQQRTFLSTYKLFHVAHLSKVHHRQRIEMLMSECFSLLPVQRLKPLKRYRPILFFDYLTPQQSIQVGSTKSFFFFVNNALNTYYNSELIGNPKRGAAAGTAVDREQVLKQRRQQTRLEAKKASLKEQGVHIAANLSVTDSSSSSDSDEDDFKTDLSVDGIVGRNKYAKSSRRGDHIITPHFVGFNVQELSHITHTPASIVIEAPWLQIINNLPAAAYRKKWGKM